MRLRSRSTGFTLIELIVVIFLIALLSSITLPRVSNVLGINLRTGATYVAGYLRTTYEMSVMRQKRMRVRFDFAQNKYWAEEFNEQANVIPPLDDTTKLDEVLEQFEDLKEKESLSEEELAEADSEKYAKVEAGSLKPRDLPSQVHLKGVYLPTEGKRVSEGTAWIDFSPGGFNANAIIYVANEGGDIYSVILQPIGGRSRIERGEVLPDDA